MSKTQSAGNVPSNKILAQFYQQGESRLIWEQWPDVQKEFSTFQEFEAYCKFLSQGRLRVARGSCVTIDRATML